MTNEIGRRREYSDQRLAALRQELALLPEVSPEACVYVIGSLGRREASEHSDLDLFIAGRSIGERGNQRALTLTEETLLKADLIRATRKLEFQDFSGDAEWVKHHAFHELIQNTGTQRDDFDNTLTERLLLLLESEPVLGDQVYSDLVDQVLTKYWRDYEGHETEFRPMFLVNDILRLWRTFCVNYEARTTSDPAEKKAKRQLKHFKLSHSRLLTCYSALLAMLGEYREQKTVTMERAKVLFAMSPIDRIQDLGRRGPDIEQKAAALLAAYEQFLSATDHPEEELIQAIFDKGHAVALPRPDPSLNEAVFDLLETVGRGLDLYRMMVV